jgi:hypothetical protein
MVNILIASLILIVLFGIVFRRGYQSYDIGRLLVLLLSLFLGVSVGALAVGVAFQALR